MTLKHNKQCCETFRHSSNLLDSISPNYFDRPIKSFLAKYLNALARLFFPCELLGLDVIAISFFFANKIANQHRLAMKPK